MSSTVQEDKEAAQDADGQQEGGQEQQTDETEQTPPPTPVEWGVRLLSILLLLGLVGYVAWQGLQPTVPAAFEYQTQLDQLRAEGDEWVLPGTIRNRGSNSVLDLLVTAELVDEGDEVVDEAELDIPLLGAGEQLPFTLWFSEDPRDYQLRFNVHSFKLP